MKFSTAKLLQARACYKRNFDARLRKQRERIAPQDHVYIHVDQKTKEDGFQKLAPTTSGPCLVQAVQPQTVIIDKLENFVDKFPATA